MPFALKCTETEKSPATKANKKKKSAYENINVDLAHGIPPAK